MFRSRQLRMRERDRSMLPAAAAAQKRSTVDKLRRRYCRLADDNVYVISEYARASVVRAARVCRTDGRTDGSNTYGSRLALPVLPFSVLVPLSLSLSLSLSLCRLFGRRPVHVAVPEYRSVSAVTPRRPAPPITARSVGQSVCGATALLWPQCLASPPPLPSPGGTPGSRV